MTTWNNKEYVEIPMVVEDNNLVAEVLPTAKKTFEGEYRFPKKIGCPRCQTKGFQITCNSCHGTGQVTIESTIPWKTVVEIYRDMVAYHEYDGAVRDEDNKE